MGLLSSLQKVVATPLVGVGNLIIKGINAVTGKNIPTGTVETALKDPVIRGLSNVIIGAGAGLGAIYATPAISGAVARAGGSKAVTSKVISAVTPKTLTGKAIAGLSVLPVTTAIIKNPQVISNTIGGVINLESNLIKTASDPSIANIKNTITENPIIAGAVGLLVGGTAVKTILPVAGNLLSASRTGQQTEAIKEQTEAIKGATTTIQPSGITVRDLSQNQTPLTPIMPQTSPVNASTQVKKRKKGGRKANLPSINQSVRVNVINSSRSIGISQTKRYLNKQLLN